MGYSSITQSVHEAPGNIETQFQVYFDLIKDIYGYDWESKELKKLFMMKTILVTLEDGGSAVERIFWPT